MPIKAPRQPHRALIHGTTTGVIIAPMLVPALKIPVDKARSFFGNHSATALMLAGKTAASPKPRAIRENAKHRQGLPNAGPIQGKVQETIRTALTNFLPRPSDTPAITTPVN